jgi:hypothetical protein
MSPATLQHGQIMQLSPVATRNRAFSGCLFIVTEPKSWGAQGYVQALGASREESGGQAYYRATWEEMDPTGGAAVWVPA